MRGVLDQKEFLSDWAAGKYERGGVMDQEKAKRKADKPKKGNMPSETVKALIDAHIVEYGFESHMLRIMQMLKSPRLIVCVWLRPSVYCKLVPDNMLIDLLN